jgi:hypothetical protein
MRAVATAVVVLLAAAFVAMVLVTIGPIGSRPPVVARWFGRPDASSKDADARRDAARTRDARRHAQQQLDEWQEQRRERLTLLTATLGLQPIGNVRQNEARLFQQASRHRSRANAALAQHATLPLCAPVQIDEWTTLRAGTPVEVIGYQRDNVVTIRYDSARYEIAAWQVGLPIAQRADFDCCANGAP